uniref:DUF627 domain-containing protein n=1 Tax=Roseihalotalea indica TaxID=2867963 RepID=A0AA49GMD2_9BACT|nr:DUF627 domain-containing protein [Tunicatimonas sp. TK19036]
MMRFFFAVLVSMLSLHQSAAQVGRIKRAISAYEQGEYDKALTRVQKAIHHKKTKNSAQAWLTQGKIYQVLARQASSDSSHDTFLQQAITSFQHAIEIDTSDLTLSMHPLDSLWVSYFTQAKESASQKNYTEAFKALQRAKMIRPDDTATYLALGDLALQQQDLTLTKQTYTYLIDSLHYEGNRLYEIYNTLIDMLSQRDSELDYTQKLVKAAQQHFPDSTHWIDREFAVLLNNHKWQEAEQLITTSELSETRQITFLRELAQQQRIDNNPESAFEYYQKALAIDPKNLDVLYDLAYLHQEIAIASEKEIGRDEGVDTDKQKQALHHYRESLRYLTEAISYDQQNDHTRQNITLVETHIGSLEKL